MAELDIEQLLDNAAKVNWLKGVYVMEIADEAMRPFVETEMRMFHIEIIANGNLCGKCSATNATKCSICRGITSQIDSKHRFSQPCYRNSDITKWLSDPWEIAKCYMSRSKDLEGKPESDLDYASILNVVINNARFGSLLTGVNMADDSNVFNKGRQARNKTMHSRLHTMTDTDLKDYCDIFIEIVKLTVAESAQYVRKIETVRDTPLSITAEEIVKLKELAARALALELTEEDIEEMKMKMLDEAKHVVKDEAEKVNGKSLMANFIEGCKESLYKLTVDHIRQQKPDDIRGEWTIKKFLKCLRIFSVKNNLSKRHLSFLFLKTHTEEDIRKWDIFLMCFILQIELHVPVSNNVLLYVKDVLAVRDDFLHNDVAEQELLTLCDYLDEPLKSNILRIFKKKYTVSETSQAMVALTSWCGEERDFNIKCRYQSKDVEKDHATNQIVISLQKKVDKLERTIERICETYPIEEIKDEVNMSGTADGHETNQVETLTNEGATGGIAVPYESDVEIRPTNVSQGEAEMMEQMMTSFKKNNDIVNNGDMDYFTEVTGCVAKSWNPGSIILKVESPSVEKLVGFWKGCTDGTVVKALSKIRDAYRKFLKNDKLEFDVVLKKKEVTRRRTKIIEDLKSHIQRLEEQVIDIDGRISRPVDKSDETPSFEQDDVKPPSKTTLIDEEDSHDPRSLDDLKPPSQSLLTDETAESYGPKILDDLKSPSQSPLTYETAESYVPKILDDLKPQSQSLLTDETAESYGPKILGSPMKSVRYGEDEADRLVKFLRQISESLSGGIKSTVKTHIRDIVNNAKENRKTEFDKSIDDFMNDAMFKGGISVNLIKQAIRGFDMIKENPQFGELVTSRLDAIEKEISEQKMPPFEKGDDKTGVSIAEEIEVEESERPRSKTHGETILKHSEKDEKSSSIGRGFEDSMLTNPSSSSKLTSKGTDDLVKKSFNLLEPSHESSAKVTEEQTKQGPLTPEQYKS